MSATEESSYVAEALKAALARGEVGLQVAAYLGGDLVVDSSAGVLAEGSASPVTLETLFPIFSVTKAVTAVALHVQADRGLVDYSAPVADYWPEFAVHGKGQTTVLDVLTHRAGIPQMPEGVTPERMCDWEWMTSHIADLHPLFPPGQMSSYHSLTFGWLVGEIVRRTDNQRRTFGTFVRDEICEPLGITDLYIGLPASAQARMATLSAEPALTAASAPSDLHRVAMPESVDLIPPIYNRPALWRAEIPGTGGITNASSCARFFAMLANGGQLHGVRVLSEQTVRRFATLRTNPREVDRVNNGVRWIGVGGLWLTGPEPPFDPVVGPVPNVLYHPGAGGSIGWAELDSGLAVAICHNRMFAGSFDANRNPLVDVGRAVRKAAEAARG